MMRRAILIAGLALLSLPSCGDNAESGEQMTIVQPTGQAGDPLPPPPAPVGPSPDELAVLDSKDCRTVADAYFGGIRRGSYAYAALFWNDPVIDGARLSALFSAYVHPVITIGQVQEEGAAGSLYCTVTGVLTDQGKQPTSSQDGQIVLRRVNDVPGATAEQLRWTIRSSSFVETMERSAKSS